MAVTVAAASWTGGCATHVALRHAGSTTVTTITSLEPVTTPQAPPAPQLVYVYQLQPQDQLFQTLRVDTNGGGAVGTFIGEVAGVKHTYFRLAHSALTRLRHQLRALTGMRLTETGGPTTIVDTVSYRGHSVRVAQSRIPRRLIDLVRTLSGLIARYQP